MTKPFDSHGGTCLVLVNEQGQYSLWPAGTAVPSGWSVARSESDRQSCVDFIESRWRDSFMHPPESSDDN